jgi:hypothetical protein
MAKSNADVRDFFVRNVPQCNDQPRKKSLFHRGLCNIVMARALSRDVCARARSLATFDARTHRDARRTRAAYTFR